LYKKRKDSWKSNQKVSVDEVVKLSGAVLKKNIWGQIKVPRGECGRQVDCAPREVGYGEWCPLPSRLGWSGEHGELSQRVQGGAPAGNAFWHILKATKCSFLLLYAVALSSSNSVSCHIWGKAEVWGEAVAPFPNIVPHLSGLG